METETLCSYNSQDKLILDDPRINIPSNDGDSNSLHSNDMNESESDPLMCESTEKQGDEENCDEIVSSSEIKIIGNHLETETNKENDRTDSSIDCSNVSSNNYEEEEEITDLGGDSINDEGRRKSTEEEESDKEASEEPSEEQDLINNAEQEVSNDISTTNNSTRDENSVINDVDTTSNHDDPLDDPIRNTSDDDSHGSNENDKNEVDPKVDPLSIENNTNTVEIQERKLENTDTTNEDVDMEKVNEKTDKETPEDNAEIEKNVDENKQYPLLKETLTKQRKDENDEDREPESEIGVDDVDMDDDFDPSLLCPDIAMEIEEAPVITTNDNVPTDGSRSPLLYEPVYSTYVDEMTGAEVTFNLSPDEHQMRQDLYGEKNPIQFSKIHCTACNVHLGSALDGQTNRFVHPLLKVLICKDCYHFYTSGEFEKDEDGSELYCRWCGQGGQVLCCSACEMVFCKKCIRINFGRKKLTEIRDSDDWYCFRCNPIQLIALRVHCAEFMEYVRREISRAATLENATSFMTTDYTQCCLSQKKKYVDPHPSEPKKRKRRTVDPDFEPEIYLSSESSKSPVDVTSASPKPITILPKPADPNLNTGIVTQVTQNTNTPGVFRVGNTTFRPRVMKLSQQRPIIQATSLASGIRPQTSTPGFIKIMPGGIRAASMQRQPAQTFLSTAVRPRGVFAQRQLRPIGNASLASPAMKHEWFEKTVRAAARVNANLSYTLTQLNRAQATASSVEALAVVHNKLQEILSTSINSLIQIRKNLRTEFIAGIKNIRFPPKPLQPLVQPSTSSQDDDVIFVSPPASPVPPLSVPTNTNITPSVSLINSANTPKKSPVIIVPTTTLEPIPSTSTSTGDRPKMFLRVKSLSALQCVPSECITIPDDPIPPRPCSPPPLAPVSIIKPPVMVIENSPERKKEDTPLREDIPPKEEDTPPKEDDALPKEGAPPKEEALPETEEKKHEVIEEKSETEVAVDVEASSNDDESTDYNGIGDSLSRTFNLKDVPPPDLKRMLNIKVCIARSKEIDELVRNKFGLVNGDVSE